MIIDFNEVECPRCRKSKICVSSDASGYVTSKCSRCGRVYIVDLETLESKEYIKKMNTPPKYIDRRFGDGYVFYERAD